VVVRLEVLSHALGSRLEGRGSGKTFLIARQPTEIDRDGRHITSGWNCV
jgi:hypothetical protein